jgi:hypothetical protein
MTTSAHGRRGDSRDRDLDVEIGPEKVSESPGSKVTIAPLLHDLAAAWERYYRLESLHGLNNEGRIQLQVAHQFLQLTGKSYTRFISDERAQPFLLLALAALDKADSATVVVD